MEGKLEGKVLHEIYIRKTALLISSSFGISISLWLLELLSRVTCCSARVLQAKSSPFLRGTSSATLGRFFFIIPEEDLIEVSSSCIHLQVVHITGGRSEEEVEFACGVL